MVYISGLFRVSLPLIVESSSLEKEDEEEEHLKDTIPIEEEIEKMLVEVDE